MPAISRHAPVPALGQPEAGIVVAAGIHERQVLVVADQSRRQSVGLEIDAVARRFVVKTEARPGMADFHDAAGLRMPRQRRWWIGSVRR